MGPTPHQIIQASEESASRMIRSFTEDQLRANSLEDLVQTVVDDKVPQPITLASSAAGSLTGSCPPRRRARRLGVGLPSGPPFLTENSFKVSLYIPYAGTRSAFDHRPNHMPVNMVEGAGHRPRSHPVRRGGPEYTGVKRSSNVCSLKSRTSCSGSPRSTATLPPWSNTSAASVTRQLQGRLDVIKKRDDMAAAFSIPVTGGRAGTRAGRPGQAHRGRAQDNSETQATPANANGSWISPSTSG